VAARRIIAFRSRHHNWAVSYGGINLARALYIAYLTGQTGNSIALLYIGDGIISGVDVGGAIYDGVFTQADERSSLIGNLELKVPEHGQLITGAEPTIPTVNIPLSLPANFDNGAVVHLQTIVGPINAIFHKTRELP